MRGGDLTVAILQDVGVCALQDAWARARITLLRTQARSVLAKFTPTAAGFDADHFYIDVAQEGVEKADGVGAATDAGKEMRGQALFCGKNLLASLAANDGLKITHHGRIRMRAEHRAKQIVRGAHIGDPVSHGF